ncbi:hypothetical protein [Dyadobacter sp. NIV53]|uniref:hypothetical protein n=1 Tax=Dyadobacter sp. NIV53 TaxID=2861765 RepID=UPI001C87A5E1|nr:hypothetical protein [Dyadobacter sp. NIV53]
MIIRKIEYFEDQLKVSETGREILQLIEKHGNEVMYLINKNRPTMVCWQRNQGPKFTRSIVDSGFEKDLEFVKEADGVKLETLILFMAEVLQDNGSPDLKMDIGKYAPLVLQMAKETSSLHEIISRINNTANSKSHA